MKEVAVRATYKYGYEWSYLYCLSCMDKGRVWLEFPFELDASATKALKRGPKGAGTVNVTVQGTLSNAEIAGTKAPILSNSSALKLAMWL
ncbi:MAG TPA: hypothetical protein VH140_14695 [Candidatus Acidoferrum sp.]|nr:hypothetical protein [Candidatus Acidoferrum sp.]